MSKFTDAELENLESMGMKPAEIAKRLGVTTAAVCSRQAKRNKDKPSVPAETPKEKPVEDAPAPGGLRFDDIKLGDRLLRNGKPIKVIGIERCKSDKKKDKLAIKDRFGYPDKHTRQYFDSNPGKFVRDPDYIADAQKPAGETLAEPPKPPAKEGPEKTIFEKVVEESKKKPGMTINQDFENAVNEMIAENKDKAGKESDPKSSDEDLLTPESSIATDAPDQTTSWPCASFDLKEIEATIEAASVSVEPINLDLEISDGSDPVDPFVNNSEPPGYIDPDWGLEASEEYIDEPTDVPNVPHVSRRAKTRREYLDEIDKLLDLMLPICIRNKWTGRSIKDLAIEALEAGIQDEILTKYDEGVGA